MLANPPFAGALDYEATAKDLQRIVKTKKTELLFLALFLRLLKIGGRATVIVPDGRRSRVSRWAANAEFEVSGPRRCVVLKTVSTRGSHASGAPGCHAQEMQRPPRRRCGPASSTPRSRNRLPFFFLVFSQLRPRCQQFIALPARSRLWRAALI